MADTTGQDHKGEPTMNLIVTVTDRARTVTFPDAEPQKWAAVFLEWAYAGTNSGMAVDTPEGRIEVSQITHMNLAADR